MFDKKITFDRFVRGLLFVLITAIVVCILGYLRNVLIPFFVAWLIAYLIFPMVHFFQHRLRLRSRMLSIIATLSLIGGLTYACIALCLPMVIEQVKELEDSASSFLVNLSRNDSIPSQLTRFLSHNHIDLQRMINKVDLLTLIKEALPKLWSVVYETANVIMAIVGSLIGLLYMFFILCDFEKLYRGIVGMIPAGHREFATSLMSDLANKMNCFFRGQALISLCVAILFSIGLSIIQFPLAIPIGLFIGVLSLVPYLHSLGLVPLVLFSLLKAATTGQNFWFILFLALLVFACVQIIEDVVLTPRIMGKEMGLPPFLILLSLSIWGYLLGIIGMIIALPLTTVIISYYKRYIVKENTQTKAQIEEIEEKE